MIEMNSRQTSGGPNGTCTRLDAFLRGCNRTFFTNGPFTLTMLKYLQQFGNDGHEFITNYLMYPNLKILLNPSDYFCQIELR